MSSMRFRRRDSHAPAFFAVLLTAFFLLLSGMQAPASAELRESKNGDLYLFDSPEDLALLCRMEEFSTNRASQSFRSQEAKLADFVLNEDLVIPADLNIVISSPLIIPAEVTLTVSEGATLACLDLLVDGSLVNEGRTYQYFSEGSGDVWVFPHCSGEGIIQNEGSLTLRNPSDRSFTEAHVSGAGTMRCIFNRVLLQDGSLEELLQEAADDPYTDYDLYVFSDTESEGDVYLPDNMTFLVEGCTFTVPEGCGVVSDAYVSLDGLLQVNGSFQNNGVVSVRSGGTIHLQDADCYRGGGSVYVESGMAFPFTGIDESAFTYRRDVHQYVLRPNTGSSAGKAGQNSGTGKSEKPETGSSVGSSRLHLFWLKLRTMLRWTLARYSLDEDFLTRAAIVLVIFLVVISGRKKTAGKKKTAPQQTVSAKPVRNSLQKNSSQPSFSSLDHDRQRRLQELDGWLKNGLIDRAEYRVLKEHIMQDYPD